MTLATYTYECSICGATETQAWKVALSAEAPKPCPPLGWRDVLGMLVCQQHEIVCDLRLVDEDYGTDDPRRYSIWRVGLWL